MPLIMVVDDDPSICESLKEVLSRAGHDVMSAQDARTAVALMRSQPPDLLLTDVIMPHTDGWALIRECRADALLANVRVLVMSGAQNMRTIALAHGAQGFLLKPFTRVEVLSEIARVLEDPPDAAGPEAHVSNCSADPPASCQSWYDSARDIHV